VSDAAPGRVLRLALVAWGFGDLAMGRRASGIALLVAELIGLAPMRAFLDVADHASVDATQEPPARVLAAARWLRIRDPRPDLALELRLASGG